MRSSCLLKTVVAWDLNKPSPFIITLDTYRLHPARKIEYFVEAGPNGGTGTNYAKHPAVVSQKFAWFFKQCFAIARH